MLVGRCNLSVYQRADIGSSSHEAPYYLYIYEMPVPPKVNGFFYLERRAQ